MGVSAVEEKTLDLLAARFEELYGGYTDDQLELILDYVRKATAILRTAAAATVQSLPPGSEGDPMSC